jgi:hypothetical protein
MEKILMRESFTGLVQVTFSTLELPAGKWSQVFLGRLQLQLQLRQPLS